MKFILAACIILVMSCSVDAKRLNKVNTLSDQTNSDFVADLSVGWRNSWFACSDGTRSRQPFDVINIRAEPDGRLVVIVKNKNNILRTFSPGNDVSCGFNSFWISQIDPLGIPGTRNHNYCNNNAGYVCNATFPQRNNCNWGAGRIGLDHFNGTAYEYVPINHRNMQKIYTLMWVNGRDGSPATWSEGNGQLAIVSNAASILTQATYSSSGSPCK